MYRTQVRHAQRLWFLGAFLVPVLTISSLVQAQRIGVTRTKQPEIDFTDRVIKFKATDGVTIEADWYPVKVKRGKKTPAAVLIHMYPADRKDWEAVVPLFRDAGISVLAYDIRGRGGSIKPESRNLKEQYEKREPAMFAMAWMDTQGATAWLQRQRNIDATKMVLVGASIGCSIALDYAARIPDVRAIVCLSPGTNYMELDSIDHIRNCQSIPILLMAPEGEFEAVQKLQAATEGKAVAKKYGGSPADHGTKMFAADYGDKVRKRMMSFVRKNLGLKAAPAGEDDEKDEPKKKKKKKSKKKKKRKK